MLGRVSVIAVVIAVLVAVPPFFGIGWQNAMTNMLIAQRSYQANLSVMDRVRDAYKSALSIGVK